MIGQAYPPCGKNLCQEDCLSSGTKTPSDGVVICCFTELILKEHSHATVQAARVQGTGSRGKSLGAAEAVRLVGRSAEWLGASFSREGWHWGSAFGFAIVQPLWTLVSSSE